MGLGLSKRMKTIISMCEPCDTIIDVGTDHGKVPIALANLGIVKHVIASDIREGPLRFCKENVALYLKNDDVNFEIVKSDGLKSIDKNLKAGIIITGMGYDLMCEILENIDEYSYEYLILSPHTKYEKMLDFLNEKKLSVVEKNEVIDKNKKYIIIKVKGTSNK